MEDLRQSCECLITKNWSWKLELELIKQHVLSSNLLKIKDSLDINSCYMRTYILVHLCWRHLQVTQLNTVNKS